MADIRINALATTASSTASDDFLAVDGSANGTRKLNAYSPTFGGNLTVSGSISQPTASAGQNNVQSLAANSGYWNSMVNNSNTGRLIWGVEGAAGSTFTGSTANAAFVGSNGINAFHLLSNGAIAATFTTSAATLAGNLTVSGGTVTSGSGTLTLNSSANTVVLQSAGTTALTLDSSQNATFAGTVTASKAGTAFYSIESTVNGALSEVIVKGKNSTGTAREARLGLNKYADDVFSIYDGTTERFRLGLTNGDATFAGKTYTAAGTAAAPAISFSGDTDSGFYSAGGNQVALSCGGGQIWNTTVNGLSIAAGKDIYLGNAYQAAIVVPTGYVTIKDSTGTAYKVCVLL